MVHEGLANGVKVLEEGDPGLEGDSILPAGDLHGAAQQGGRGVRRTREGLEVARGLSVELFIHY